MMFQHILLQSFQHYILTKWNLSIIAWRNVILSHSTVTGKDISHSKWPVKVQLTPLLITEKEKKKERILVEKDE